MRSIVRLPLTRNLLLLGLTAAGAIVCSPIGCSSSDRTGSGAPEPITSDPSVDNAGTVGMQLTLPGGEEINSVNWTVTGPNGASTVVQTGVVNVGGSTTISFLIGGIPAGSNYSISLTGTSPDGTTTCAGAATFNTAARTTTNVSVALACNTATADSGSALVTANAFNCGQVTSISASPAEVIVGNPVALNASATGPAPSVLTYAWTAPAGSGSFSNPALPNPSFTCATAGAVTLTLNVSDGVIPDGGACTTSSSSIQVQCDGHLDAAQPLATATKIKHLVIIFDENISFDHYYGTYPNATNNLGPGDTAFTAAPGTPVPNNLIGPLDPTHGFAPTGANLLTTNPNNQSGNGTGATNPFRLPALFAETKSMNHSYGPEQEADDHGNMDLFPFWTGTAGPPPGNADAGEPAITETKGLVMAYYDGNTVNTWWNYAQQYALNDNMWTTNFGPSTVGGVNLISGQTNGLTVVTGSAGSSAIADGNGGLTLIGDIDPALDVCSPGTTGSMAGKNIGDLLNAASTPVTWGWFQGGFNLTASYNTNVINGVTFGPGCTGATPLTHAETVPYGTTAADYVQHHEPFQLYASTRNPTHTPPTSPSTVGTASDPANHQYDIHDFFTALSAGNLPAVSYLKAPAYENGHPSNSDPIDEQNFVSSVVSAVQAAQEWSSTAIVLTYDDSDGWYDHQAPPIVNSSATTQDFLNGSGLCNSGAQQNGAGPAPTTPLLGVPSSDGGAPAPAQGRCGYGSRIPLMVISPFSKKNYIDHTLVDQSSVLKFVEDNWLGGQRIQPGGSFDTIAGSLQNTMSGI